MTAATFGGAYVLAGLVGFGVTGFAGTGTLVIFNLGVLDNIVHIAIGVTGLAAYAAGAAPSRMFCQGAGAVLALLAIVGIVVSNPLGILPVGGADVVLHGVSAVVVLYSGFVDSVEAI